MGTSDPEMTDTATAEACPDTPAISPDVRAPLYVASAAVSQFASTTGLGNNPTVISPQTTILEDHHRFDEEVDEPLVAWANDAGDGFVEVPGIRGCFVARRFIFVERGALAAGISGITGISEGAYAERGPGSAGDFSDSSDVVHVGLEPAVEPMEMVRELLAEGIAAAPEYAFAIAPRWKYGPGAEPIVPGPEIPALELPRDAPRVNVIDFFGSNTSMAASFHGNFIEGILGHLSVATDRSPVGPSDLNFAPELKIAASLKPGINNISMGGHGCSGPGGIVPAPIGIPGALMGRDDIRIVASAGNDSTADECFVDTFPARYASFTEGWIRTFPKAVQRFYTGIARKVVSVGALSGTSQSGYSRASFSNGGVNTVWAPGVGIVSDYASGTAIWAGTSFATPVVAAAIARGEFR